MKRIILSILFFILSTYAWAVVPNQSPLKNVYSCNSSTTQFPYSFPISATSDMAVYTVDASGNITTQTNFSVDTTNVWVNYPLSGPSCPTGTQLVLLPATPKTQTLALTARSPFVATAIGGGLDKLTMITQQLQEQVNRAVLSPVNSNAASGIQFPNPLANAYIGWDPTGAFLTNLNSAQNLSSTSSPTFAGMTITGLNGIGKYSAGALGVATADVDYSTPNGTETLTNKTFDTTGTGNVFKLAGTTLTQTSVTGTGLKLVTGTGTYTSGNCLKINANGDAVDNGSACSGGSGMTYPASAGIAVTDSSSWLASIPTSTLTTQSVNVGIGTTGPTQKLEVNGTVKSTAYTTSGAYTQSGTSANTFTGTPTFSNATYSALFTGGNVGIGTTTPQGSLVITNGNVGIGTWVPNNSLIVKTGNVGIGTVNPGTVLDVSGTMRTTNFIMTSGGPATGYMLTSTGSVGLGTWSPATSGSAILYGNGSGGFSNVTIGTGLLFTGGTLSNTSPTNIQTFTSSGTFTAPTGITKVYLTMVGGGGGGGASGGGATDGTDGGNTSFDSTVIASGGKKGTAAGVGGVGGGSSLIASTITPGGFGYTGGAGANNSSSNNTSGAGGGTLFGPGTAGGAQPFNATNATANTGGGGGGSADAGASGGGGGGGQSLVNYPYTVVAGNNYTVTIGAKGTGGTGNRAGGDGGSGIVIVHY